MDLEWVFRISVFILSVCIEIQVSFSCPVPWGGVGGLTVFLFM